MSDINKMYWQENKKYKLFGKVLFETDSVISKYDGKGDFINSTCPNKEYFEAEFKKEDKKNEKQ